MTCDECGADSFDDDVCDNCGAMLLGWLDEYEADD